jgi:hypothetical protein
VLVTVGLGAVLLDRRRIDLTRPELAADVSVSSASTAPPTIARRPS